MGLFFAIVLVIGCQREGGVSSPEEELSRGWRAVRLQEFGEAEGAFTAALEEVRGEDAEAVHLRVNATYGLGLIASLAHHGEGDAAARARDLFNQVIRLDPKSDEAAWAGLGLIRDDQVDVVFQDGGVERGDRMYAAFIAAHPHTAAGEEAFVDQMALHVQTQKAEEEGFAISAIGEFLRENPGTREKSGLYALLSKAHRARGEFPEALAAAIASVEAKEIDPANPVQNNISEYYRIGMMAQYDVGDFATARKYYRLFLKEYPRDLRAFNVKRMLLHLDATEAALRGGKQPPTMEELPPTLPVDSGGAS